MSSVTRAAAFGLSLATLVAASARADTIAPAPEATARSYEGYSALAGGPYGPIDAARARELLGAWIDVTTTGDVTDIVFRPDGRVRWRLTQGRHGVVTKTTTVDGELWTESTFGYDATGRIATKRVTGPGAHGGLRYTYRTRSDGKILERSGGGDGAERWVVRWDAGGAVAETLWNGVLNRSDRYDRAGRLVRSDFGLVALSYDRDGSGALTGVRRHRPSVAAGPARHDARDLTLGARDLSGVSGRFIERREAHLLFGEPASVYEDGRGITRSTKEHYPKDCWLNRTSGFAFDAADLSITAEASCICGLCVDAQARVSGDEILGRDTHWTDGPWIRLDGALDLTADHKVLTPTGARPAGELRAGDLVLLAVGSARRLRTVEHLPPGPARRGLNLRTRSATFTAGDFLVESEPLRSCP